MASTVTISTDIESALAKRLADLSKRLNEDQAATLRQAVQNHVDEQLELLDFLQQGIDACDRGEVHTQEEVEAWFEARYRDVAAE